MQLVVIVLNKVEVLDKMLKQFGNENIPGATILDTQKHQIAYQEDK